MKTFKINKTTNKVTTTIKLDYDMIVTSGDGLCVVTEKEKALEVTPGTKLHFEKYASGNTGTPTRVCERDVNVLNVVDDANGIRHIYTEYPYIDPLTITSFLKIDDSGTKKFKFYFAQEHNMVPLYSTTENVPTDFDSYIGDYRVYIRRENNTIYFDGLELCYPSQIVRGKNIFKKDGDCCQENPSYFNYDTMEKNSIIATGSGITMGIEFAPEEGDQVIFCTNPYFWTGRNGELTLFENVSIAKYTDFMGLDVVLEEDCDAKRMFQEYQVNELFVEKVKKSIVPGFIDLEKVKFAPAYEDVAKNEFFLATGLTFNLHFRSRVMNKTEKYKFEDTWHLDDTLDTWNGNGQNPVKLNKIYSTPAFVNYSDTIGYLGFTDDDIYNQKMKVKQSFLRLSFYDSPNPLEQNLLFYSTIFMDSGELFGKFIKRKAWLQESEASYNEEDEPVVWSFEKMTDEVPAVTSQFNVNDEYDMTKSGEGFNLYLFKQDAPIENEEKPIYMKVEFNHAGYGRTVPFILWRTKNNVPVELTTSNYFESLYIPLNITLTDKGYVYTVGGKTSDDDPGITVLPGYNPTAVEWLNDRLVFNLFEPKLELQGDSVPEVNTIPALVTGTFEQE